MDKRDITVGGRYLCGDNSEWDCTVLEIKESAKHPDLSTILIRINNRIDEKTGEPEVHRLFLDRFEDFAKKQIPEA